MEEEAAGRIPDPLRCAISIICMRLVLGKTRPTVALESHLRACRTRVCGFHRTGLSSDPGLDQTQPEEQVLRTAVAHGPCAFRDGTFYSLAAQEDCQFVFDIQT